MPLIIAAFLIGIIAGLRAITAPMAVSWAARLGWIPLTNTPLAFLGYTWTPYIFTLIAIGEIINDKLPETPSRKVPPQFIGRVLTGAFSGAALGLAQQSLVIGLLVGAVGAVVGTLGGAAARGQLAKSFGKDLPAALLEDLVAVVGAFLIVSRA